MRISVVGTGYVGVVSATCLAMAGHTVTCVDARREIVSQINRGRSPIYERGLDDLLEMAVAKHRLHATTDTRSAVVETDVTLICVGTPTTPSGIDLSQILSASEAIGLALAEKASYHVIAVKSTVLPGTCEGIVRQTVEVASGRGVGDGWGLAMNPEFLREGQAVDDFQTPDRIVIGAIDRRTADMLVDMYAYCACPKFVTTPRTAEMIKYASNALFATLISFSNELANVCQAVSGVNAYEVWRGVHLDRRLTVRSAAGADPVGAVDYLWHGLGFGGSCFPKDVAALQHLGRCLGQPTPILDAILQTNASQPLQMIALLEREMSLTGRAVAVLGLAFKPGTDDLRESPSIPIVNTLRDRGASVIAHDPAAMHAAQDHPAFRGVAFAPDVESAVKNTDACCLVTAWPEYRTLDPRLFARLMRTPLVVDGRGMLDPDRFAEAGVKWVGIGYAPAPQPLCGAPTPASESLRALGA